MILSNSRPLVTFLFACTTLLAGCHPPGKPGPEPEVVRPEQVLDFPTLYGQNCAACHGANGKSGAAISLANPVYLAIAGKQNIVRITSEGVPNTAMPPFGRSKGGMLTDAQISVIADGMQQAWGNASALGGQTPPAYSNTGTGNAANGQKAFATYCAQCHGVDGASGKLPSGQSLGSLVDPAYLALVSDQGLRSIILAGQFDKTPHDWRSYPVSGGAPAKPITDQDVTDIVAWLASQRIATPGQPYATKP